VLWVAAAAGGVLAGGSALGQNALGDGRALDVNTRVGGPGYNQPVRDILGEIRFRNAIVTGNAPNGLSFRGDAGYGAAFDFRDSVGSDDLFAFRRDSVTSGLAGMGIRGTEALQYQFALTVGNAPPRQFRGSLLTSRTGDRLRYELPESPLEVPPSGMVDFRPATPSELGAEAPGTALSLRSTSLFTADRSLSPALLGMIGLGQGEEDSGERAGLIASPLRGVARERLVGDSERGGQDGEGQDDGRAEGQGEDQGEDRSGRVDRRMPSGRLASGQTGGVAPPDPRGEEGDRARSALRDRLRAFEGLADPERGEDEGLGAGRGPGEGPADGGAARLAPLEERLEALREAMRRGLGSEREGEDAGTPESPGEDREGGDEGGEDGDGPLGAIRPTPIPGVEDWAGLVRTLREGAGTLGGGGERLDASSAYALHLRRGKALMAEGRYFDAEQRFTMALAARPNDVMASIGRIHAQLGAGLDLSASVNLRAFLSQNPEFVGVRYEADLLPEDRRLKAARERLSRQVRRRDGATLVRESALLLAYVGFQTDDRVAVMLGLNELARGDAGKADALVPLVRGVWLPERDERGGG